ncbi:unnamed protein product [Meganyctiphanes norvegica]|uniref:Fibrinogen C-terminal domain-containing protein n=1 Tax=Meganyctiphanes norvegica TaxID=48144 RepID=A0AAV2PW26_MEGNR
MMLRVLRSTSAIMLRVLTPAMVIIVLAINVAKAADLARNCKDLQISGMSEDGTGTIYPFSEHPEQYVTVYCDQTTAGGGWTVILRRDNYEFQEDFYRSFDEYATGFGDVKHDFWLGNDVIHELTNQGITELYVDLEDWEGETKYAYYKFFYLAGREPDAPYAPPYQMEATLYEGTAGDCMAYQNGMGFTTFDNDMDDKDDGNCAEKFYGAWWHRLCYMGMLTGRYYPNSQNVTDGVMWWSFHIENEFYTLKRAAMMVRPQAL